MCKLYETILLDMDGVLVQFTQGVLDCINKQRNTNYTLDDLFPRRAQWNMENLWGMSAEEWWNALETEPDFWLNLRPYPWAKELYNRLQKYADRVVISSAPSQNPRSWGDKMSWLRTHLEVPYKNIMIGKSKFLMSKPGVLLVDDYKANTEKFTRVDNGGDAVLLPSDWNTHELSFEHVWASIEAVLKQKKKLTK